MKKIALTLLLLHGLSGFTQNRLIGIWNFIEESHQYKIYIENRLYNIYDYTHSKNLRGIRISEQRYGFYAGNKERLPSIDSLTIKDIQGEYISYYPEDIKEEYEEDEDVYDYVYGGLSVEMLDEDSSMMLMASTAEQTGIYKRVYILPKHVEEIIEENNPKIYTDYLKVAWNRGEIKVKKSIIHTDKKVATKAYLVKDDVIEILERQAKWLRIRYTSNKNKITTGWIKKSDIK